MILVLLILLGGPSPPAPPFCEGDLIFHTSRSGQSRAVQVATHSPYSHLGVLLRHRGALAVYEAIQPVTATPLRAWIARGEGGHFVLMRLRDADRVLTPRALGRLRAEADRHLGRPYDPYFEWSDERLYCSEYVYKIYSRAVGVRLGTLQQLRDFDLRSAVVQRKLRERFGDRIPLDETVLSPGAVFASPLLEQVGSR